MQIKLNTELIQIYLLTFNRVELLIQAVDSITKQTYENIELIISDNSDNLDTKTRLEKLNYLKAPNIKYKFRNNLSSLDHFNIVLSEVSANYFMLFHDDDLMFPEMVSELYKEIAKNENRSVVAVGANALLMHGNNKSKKKYFKNSMSSKSIIKVGRPMDLARMYINENIIPFSSYLYRSSSIREKKFDLKKGGKYCDCAFLLDVNSVGSFHLILKPMMYLRIHENQDSKDHSLRDNFLLKKYIKKITNNSIQSKELRTFQIRNIYAQYTKGIFMNRYRYFSKKTLRVSLMLIFHRNYIYFIKLHVKSLIKALNPSNK